MRRDSKYEAAQMARKTVEKDLPFPWNKELLKRSERPSVCQCRAKSSEVTGAIAVEAEATWCVVLR